MRLLLGRLGLTEELSDEEKELRELTKQIMAHYKGMPRKMAEKIARNRLKK